jgi:hypothetical protein
MQEIYGLEALEAQMSRNLDGQRRRRAAAAFDSTFVGRLISWGGRLFALYCIFRFLSVRKLLYSLIDLLNVLTLYKGDYEYNPSLQLWERIDRRPVCDFPGRNHDHACKCYQLFPVSTS